MVTLVLALLVAWAVARERAAMRALQASHELADELRTLAGHAAEAGFAGQAFAASGDRSAGETLRRARAAAAREARALQRLRADVRHARNAALLAGEAARWEAHPASLAVDGPGADGSVGAALAHAVWSRAHAMERVERARLSEYRALRRERSRLALVLLAVGALVSTLCFVATYRRLLGEGHVREQFTGALQDANTRLKAQAAELERSGSRLAEAGRRMQLLLESTSEGVCGIDCAGRCTFANGRAAELLRARAEELLGVDLHRLVHGRPADGSGAPEDDNPVNRVLRTGEGIRVSDDVLWRLDGTSFPAEYAAFPIRENGAVTGAVLTFCDISGRRASEARLRASEEELRTLIAAMTEVILVVDADGRYVRIGTSDPAVGGGLGTGGLGRTLHETFAPAVADRLRGVVREVQSTGVSASVEYSLDGTEGTRWFLATVSRIQEGRMLWVARDVTERRRTEEALRHSQEQLVQAQKMDAIGQLAGGIAHDFNNLLTAIRGNAQLLLMDLGEDDPIRQDLLEIDRAGERAAALTRQLLTFGRKEVTQPRLLSLNDVVRSTEKLLARLIREDVTITTRLAPDLACVWADPAQLEMVILNLCINARDAMPAGGRLEILTRNADGAADLAGPAVVLEVRDTGHGMDEGTRKHLFEPFFTTKPAGQGTGLGLATIYGAVSKAGGRVEVESQPGAGATFTVILPVAAEGGPDAPPAAHGARESAGRGETLLLVEDEPAVRTLAARLLTRAGYRVVAADGGAQALHFAGERSDIELMISDVVMPGMSGPALLAEMKRTGRDWFPVLLMSGHADDAAEVERLLRAGIPVLWKPFTPEELLVRVRTVLDGDPA